MEGAFSGFDAVVDGAQVQVDGFEAAEVAFGPGEVLVGPDHRVGAEFSGCGGGTQDVDAVEGGLGRGAQFTAFTRPFGGQ